MKKIYNVNKDKLWDDRLNKDTHVKWKLNLDDAKQFDYLLHNEFEAKSRMLPKETQLWWDKNSLFKFLQVRSIEEVEYSNKIFINKIKEKIVNMAQEQARYLEK